jgi:hypothetical protein
MLYCLFSHTSAKAFQDIVVRVGERYLIRRAPLSVLVAIANKIALRIAQRSAGRMITRWVPAVGALGVAGFVYVDTGKVADNSIDFFERDVKIEGSVETATAEVSTRASGAKAKSTAAEATSKPVKPRSSKAAKPDGNAGGNSKSTSDKASAASTAAARKRRGDAKS